MVTFEARNASTLDDATLVHGESARNLLHYVALRRRDMRELQEELAAAGLSSLGRSEAHVLAGVDAVARILAELVHAPAPAAVPLVDRARGRALLGERTVALFGPAPAGRKTRIVVTLPADAADEPAYLPELVARGMDVARINCGRDDVDTWLRLAAGVERARRLQGRACQIAFDLAGPKLRTGAIDGAGQIVRWRPRRDERGRVVAPARIWLGDGDQPPREAAAALRLATGALATGDRLILRDGRGRRRELEVAERTGGGFWAHADRTAYLDATAAVALERAGRSLEATVLPPPEEQRCLRLHTGDHLRLTRAADAGRPGDVATIPCTLPEVFPDVRAGERIFFDDGKLAGIVESAAPDALLVRITAAGPTGAPLRSDRGINLPDTSIGLPALTAQDLADLGHVGPIADLIGLSFVRRPADVRSLQQHLARRGLAPGIVLKIETRAAFDALPAILLQLLHSARGGVMIARGDLAVECGWERLAELQEEILWFCEAAHTPVIWATQVLEGVAKTGSPTRAEITDAAMSQRAEAVMLNKGPYLVEAVRMLDDILRRMSSHQRKKTAMLRRLGVSDRGDGLHA